MATNTYARRTDGSSRNRDRLVQEHFANLEIQKE
ncbi:MAG: hypothetical protein RLZZ338_1752 [Cyanobacteriota bacterium]|jgi:hypothetical protein